MGIKRVKVAITGAAGQIGYALLFRVASGQMFGPNTEVELQLLELKTAMDTLHGVAMELDDCAFPLLKNIMCTDDLNRAFQGVNWALLVGSIPRKAKMERADLLNTNGGIFGPQGKALGQHAAKDLRCLVVGNPCNTNALIAMNGAKDIPNERFFAMTMLDENRARTQLAQKAQVAISQVTHMGIWGNHSATQWPDFYHARIKGQAATEVIADEAWLKGEFVETVQKRGAAIIKARGASSAASAASGIVDTVYHLTHDTPVGHSFSVAKCSRGEYGVEEGLIFSYPCRTEKGQLTVVSGIEQSPYGQKKFQITHEELKSERDIVKSAGFLKSS